MSNKTVPVVYRQIIDDVIDAIKDEFEAYGVDESVLADLHQRWQAKVVASNVAEFEVPRPEPPPQYAPAALQHLLAAGAPTFTYDPRLAAAANAAAQQAALAAGVPLLPGPVLAGPPGGVAVKAEPVDARFPVRPTTLHPTTLAGYALPPLPGPALGRAPGPQGAYPPGTRLQPPPPRGAHPASAAPPGPARIPQVDGPAGSSMDEPVSHVRIPQVDGPGSSSSDEDQPGPAYAPRTAHPSLPQPPARAPVEEDPEAINSDLDDPDEDDVDEEETANMRDIAFCTYDKVSRVRNKWKCTFKEGMMHINGKDYLFNKCTAEFEW